ncbi:MAG: glycosyltransferase family 9 protein [Sedimentisphaerales bacterium]|nr:glycosyltransferase family 9 protein [Sedimentisphaerales bacterium]
MCSNKKCGLIIQPGAVGDGILTLPLARLLRQEWRLDHIDIMGHTEKMGYLQGRSDITRIISIDDVKLHQLFHDSSTFNPLENDSLIDVFRNYELIVSFLSDEKGHFEQNLIYTAMTTHAADVVTIQLIPPGDYVEHAAHFFMEQFISELPHSQVTIYPEVMEGQLIRPRPDDAEKGWSILKAVGVGSDPKPTIVAIHPGSGGAEKCWPLKNYQDLSERLKKQGCQPIMLLGPVEQERWGQLPADELKAQVPLLQGLTLDEVAAVLSCCSGYVGNDSGISHLAGGMGLGTVAIFGPSNPQNWRPLGEKVRVCVGAGKVKDEWATVNDVHKQLADMI